MKTCGVELKGSEVIFCVIDSRGDVLSIPERKMELSDADSTSTVQAFYSDLKEYLFKLHVDKIVIKKRAKKGKFAGGPDSFKIEGLLQLMEFCTVELVAPQSIAQIQKNQPRPIPESVLKYQEGAFWTALSAL